MEIIPSNPQVDGYLVGDKMSSKHAVMALSGGMDSTSLLLHLLNEGSVSYTHLTLPTILRV